MKKTLKCMIILQLLFVSIFVLSACDLLGGSGNNSQEFEEEFESSSGKWTLMDDEDTYFEFDGSNNIMTFKYFEDGSVKYNGKYRVIYRGNGKDVLTPLTFIFVRSDKEKEDWLSCYIDDLEAYFTQFTIMQIEEDLGFIDGTVYTHIYRISELPYKMGTYILEGNEYKEEYNDYYSSDEYYISSGTYSLDSGESFTFLTTKPKNQELFQYKNGDVVIEGTYTVAADKKTIYLYIEHDAYSKVTKQDKEQYDTTFSLCYPPDFYLRGDFSNSDSIIINDLYHHGESPSQIEDSIWVFGTYKKTNI